MSDTAACLVWLKQWLESQYKCLVSRQLETHFVSRHIVSCLCLGSVWHIYLRLVYLARHCGTTNENKHPDDYFSRCWHPSVWRGHMPRSCHRQPTDVRTQREGACWKLFLPSLTAPLSTSLSDHRRCKNTSARPDLQSRGLLQQCPLWRLWSPPAPTSVSGTTYHRQVEVRPHRQHHARRHPLASGTTTYPVQAEYVSQQVPSSHCTVVPHRHVHPGVNSIWWLVSTVVLTPWLENPALSTVTIRITQLLRVRSHSLELTTNSRSQWLVIIIILLLSSSENWTI